MLNVRNLKVSSLSTDWFDVTWEIDDTIEDVWDYTFTVERSESELGPWDAIGPAFTDQYWFRDVLVRPFSELRRYWYRIAVRKKNTSDVEYTAGVMQGPRIDLIAAEVRRLELIAFREHIGRQCIVFPRRTFGQRCPECYDHVSRQQIKEKCVTCYDTTFVRGYLDPIMSYIQIDPTPKHTEQMSLAETEQVNATGRLTFFPLLKPKDIIVEVENKRWRVERVTPTERLRAVLHQEVVLHAVPRDDIEYRLPVRLDVTTFEASPLREFTNPHNLEADQEARYGDAARAAYAYRGRQ
jgi:hypothetical protein